MNESARALEGRVIEGRYRIIRSIAEGGMATVYEAMDERLERTVAIKVMHIQLAQGPHRDQFVERFRREAKSAAAIANPHIVQVYDTGEVDGLDYLVMEFVHGVNLRHEINHQHTFSVRETLRIVAETLDGLSSAHRAGVVHRDIKPENILLNERGHVQITDFGLAKAASQATLSTTGMLLGTAAYLAPEMIERNEATPQGDLYSVGIMAWEMLAGQVPFASDNPVTLVFKHVHEDVPSITTMCPGISPKVAAFIARLTARSVDARPADATAAARELRELCAHLDIPAWTYRRSAHDMQGATAQSQTQSPAGQAQPDDTPTMATVRPADGTETLTPPTPPASSTRPTSSTASTQPEKPSSYDSAHADETRDHATDPISTASHAAESSDSPHTVGGADANVSAESTPGNATKAMPRPSDEFTKVITRPLPGEKESLPATAAHADATARTGRRRTRLIAIISTVAGVLALTGGAFAWWFFLGPGSYWTVPKPDDVTCTQNKTCSLTGATWDAYRSTLDVSNIPYTVTADYSDDIAKGRIIKASPANVGDRIGKRSGGTMHITISKGARAATVPADILDSGSASYKAPLEALANAGFDNVEHDATRDDYSLSAPEGATLYISVTPGTTMRHDEKIVVGLSKGPKPVAMPDVVGKSRDEANSMLREAKINVTFTEEYDDAVEAGSVISSSEEAGAQLHWGDDVQLVVSKGPQTARIPSGLVGKSEDEVTQQLKALGFEVKTNKVLGGLFGTVRSISNGDTDISDGGTVRLRDKDGKATVITITIV